YEIVDALAKQYGFDYRFIWPPYIRVGHKPLVVPEQAIADSVDPALDRLYQAVHQRVSASAALYPRLLDMTSAFDDYSELVWIDDVHVTPVGNRLLAAHIAATVTNSSTTPPASTISDAER